VIAALARTQPQLVLLLGWMHLLPDAFLEQFPETINLHPAFLPLDPAADETIAAGRFGDPGAARRARVARCAA